MIKVNDFKFKLWVFVFKGSDFLIQNLFFGIFKILGLILRMCIVIGDYIVDLQVLLEYGFFDDFDVFWEVFVQLMINNFMVLGKIKICVVCNCIFEVFDDDLEDWDVSQLVDYFFYLWQEVEMLFFVEVGDYIDFYFSCEYVINVGIMFWGKDNVLMLNWLYLFVGYYGCVFLIIVLGIFVCCFMG